MFGGFLKVCTLFLFKKNLDQFFSVPSEIAVKIKFIDPEGCKKAASENNWQANFVVDIDEILKNSAICVIAEVSGRLVHWTQISFGGAYVAEIERQIRVDSESAYLHGVYTAKDYRRMGIASAVTEELSAYLRERGVRQMYILIDSHNSSMLGVAAKAGFKRIGAIKLIRIGKLKLYRTKGEISDFFKPK